METVGLQAAEGGVRLRRHPLYLCEKCRDFAQEKSGEFFATSGMFAVKKAITVLEAYVMLLDYYHEHDHILQEETA